MSFTVFSFVSYMHIHMPLRMYWPREMHNFNHDNVRQVQSFISPPRFMFVSAAVSEIHDLNQNNN